MSNSNSDDSQKNFQNPTENKTESSQYESTNMISLSDLSDNSISNLLGLNVEVTLKIENILNEEKVKGNIFSIMKNNNLLILLRRDENEQNSIKSYMINIQSIQSIKLSEEKFETEFQEINNPNLDKIFENERKNLEKDMLLKKSELDKQNSEEIQKIYQKGYNIYEKLCKFYKCSYENNKIILIELDAFIEEPFNVENIHCDNDYTKNRLIRMIESCLK